MSKTENGRVKLPFISPEAFVSPADRMALNNLQKVPFVPQAIKKFNELALDRLYYTQNTSESVRCGPDQFHTVYGLMQEACRILGVPRPELYVQYSVHHGAYTAGVSRTFIVLGSGLFQGFTDEEILFVIGHELGHIKCGHLLYQMVARMLLQTSAPTIFNLSRVALKGVYSAFFEWLRQAEYSCDRAGLLVCQDPQVAYSAIMKLGCGTSRFDSEMNVEAFLKQARSYSEERGGTAVSKALLFWLQNWGLDHPQVVYRAKNLEEWVQSGAYERIINGNYPRA